MIDEQFFEVTRPDDGEKVGFLRIAGEDFQAIDLLGRPVGEEQEFLDAEQALVDLGISYLSGYWYLNQQPGKHAATDVDRRVVRILAVDRDAVCVSTGTFGVIGEDQEHYTLALPLDPGVLEPVPDEDLTQLHTISR